MKISETDFQYMLECLERDLSTLLVEEYHMSIHQALDFLYNSDTYQALQNPKTGLYFQSPRYIFSYLSDELKNGKMGQP